MQISWGGAKTRQGRNSVRVHYFCSCCCNWDNHDSLVSFEWPLEDNIGTSQRQMKWGETCLVLLMEFIFIALCCCGELYVSVRQKSRRFPKEACAEIKSLGNVFFFLSNAWNILGDQIRPVWSYKSGWTKQHSTCVNLSICWSVPFDSFRSACPAVFIMLQF